MFRNKKRTTSDNGQVSKNFNRSEFACRCGCGFAEPDSELVYVVQDIRDHFNKPVSINSACRCRKHNKSVGGAKASKHIEGIAADVVVHGVEPAKVYEYLLFTYPGTYGMCYYNTFTHVDVRDIAGRWNK